MSEYVATFLVISILLGMFTMCWYAGVLRAKWRIKK